MKSTHANRGRAFEHLLDAFHARYVAQRRACVVRTPPPMRILRSVKPGQFVAVYEAEGPPDYIAHASGVGFMLEAKHSASRRWAFSKLHAHQARRLDEWEREGGFGAVLLHFASSRESFVLPWSTLASRWHSWNVQHASGRRAASGRASLTRDDANSLGALFSRDGWLDVALALHAARSQSRVDSEHETSAER